MITLSGFQGNSYYYCDLVLHWAHSGLDEPDTRLHGEDHEGAGHDPGGIIVLELLSELGQDVEDHADVFMFIADNPFIAFWCDREKKSDLK